MNGQKIAPNLFKYGKNNYRIVINRKNNLGEQINIDLYFEAENDDMARIYLERTNKENNLEKTKKKNKGNPVRVELYIYEYGKNYYRILIPKTKKFPEGYSEYYEDNLKNVRTIRDEILAKNILNKTPVLRLKNLKLEEFFVEEFIAKSCKNRLSEATIDDYYSDFYGKINSSFGHFTLKQLEMMTNEIQLFINGLKKLKKEKLTNLDIATNNIYISTKYQNTIYNTLNTILNCAVSFKGMEENPMKDIKPPKFKTKKTKIYSLTKLNDILEALIREPIRERFLISLLITSGLRRGELVGLHKDDFDFENNCIYVERTAIYSKLEKRIIEKDTKSENGIRTIYLPEFVMNYAKLWFSEREQFISVLTEREKRLRNQDYIAPDNIFISRFGDIMFPDTVGKVWKHFRNKNGFGNDVTPHGLRTSFATNQYHENDELTMKEIALIMGHGDNISMTEHYTQALDEKLKGSVALFKEFNEKMKYSNNENTIYLTFDQIATIMTGRIYGNTDKIYNIVKDYYNTNENINYEKMPKLLYMMRKDLLSNKNVFKDIESFINESDNDWKILEKGKLLFGNRFKIDNIDSLKSNTNITEIDNEKAYS